MSDKSKIEWTEATWNPIRAKALNADGTERKGWHCEHASEGCRFCYAETFNKRLGTGFDYKPGHLRENVAVYLDEKMLLLPLKWRKPRQIFVCSMTDLFADFVSDEMLDRIFAVMALCPQHTFQVLTKRSARMLAYFQKIFGTQEAPLGVRCPPWSALLNRVERAWMAECEDYMTAIHPMLSKNSKVLADGPLPNVWIGVSVENQAAADERILDLLATPAAVRWLSCEPLLGPVNLREVCGGHFFQNPLTGHRYHDAPEGVFSASDYQGTKIDWVVAGGESGKNARPMHPDWARSLRDQCAPADVAFFFKQWGEYLPEGQFDASELQWAPGCDGKVHWWGTEPQIGEPVRDGACSIRIGKKAAGRLLDAVAHNCMPLKGIAHD